MFQSLTSVWEGRKQEKKMRLSQISCQNYCCNVFRKIWRRGGKDFSLDSMMICLLQSKVYVFPHKFMQFPPPLIRGTSHRWGVLNANIIPRRNIPEEDAPGMKRQFACTASLTQLRVLPESQVRLCSILRLTGRRSCCLRKRVLVGADRLVLKAGQSFRCGGH